MAEVASNPAPEPAAVLAPAPRPGARQRYNQTMRLVRRCHLYAGLFMTPWVFLYGVTALLFNHPGAFPDQSPRAFGPAETAGTPLADFPEPDVLAGQVVAALNAEATAEDAPQYRIAGDGKASYARDLAAVANVDGRQHTIRLDLATGRGELRSGAATARPTPAPFATKGLKLDNPPSARLKAGLTPLLGKLGIEGEDVNIRQAPDLVFPMGNGQETWKVSYNLQTGAVTGRPMDAPREPLTTRRFLTRLHVAHGYPTAIDARWIWAVAVDAMFLSMVGWGITGLLMWWQMKNVRRVGAIVLVLSLIVATAVAFGMHTALTA